MAVGPEQIVTCTVRNNFDYAPSGIVTKVNAPKIVRGDGNGTPVTSTYTVENTGNTPVTPVAGSDTECSPIEYVMTGGVIAGDDGNGLLDPGETWTLQCTRQIQHATTATDVVIDNTVTLSGHVPNGDVVSGSATDDIQVLTPDITLVKTVSPTSGISPLDVTYTYVVTAIGNAPLSDVTLVDDTPPCSNPANVTLADDGDGDALLEPGESWTCTCDAGGLTDRRREQRHRLRPAPHARDPAGDRSGRSPPIGGRVEASDDAEVTVQRPTPTSSRAPCRWSGSRARRSPTGSRSPTRRRRPPSACRRAAGRRGRRSPVRRRDL